MARGKVFWRNNELFIQWEKIKAGKSTYTQPTPVRDASIVEAMKQMPGAQEAEVEIELTSGTPSKITFVNQDLSDKAEQDAQEKARIQEEQMRRAAELQRVNEEDQEESGTKLKPEFHNPYNFVPAVPREKVNKLKNDKGEINDLGDKEPSGHDRFISDKYSGKLRVKMRVETPLLLPDAARMGVGEIGDKDHKSFPVRVRPLLDEQGNEVKDSNGKTIEVPDINPTAIKGMLRSAYEAITNSRLSAFKEHDERLAYRPQASSGISLIPARIIAKDRKIVLYKGTTQIDEHGVSENNEQFPSLFAAWLRRYRKHNDENAPQLSSGVQDEHGKHVWAYVTRWEYRKKKYPYTSFDFWNVVELLPITDTEPVQPSEKQDRTPWINANPARNSEGQWAEGFICHTNQNIQSKHDERVFFSTKNNPTEEILLTKEEWKDLEKKWKELINNYRRTHEENNGKLETPPKDKQIGKPLFQWSRHIQRAKVEKELTGEALCYAQVEYKNGAPKVLEIFPVMISRKLHEISPERLLPDCLKPADNIRKLSPADRVFGWVRQGKDKTIGAYRGQVGIGAVEYKGIKENGTYSHNTIDYFGTNYQNWLSLNILGQPKPQQGRFYVAKTQNGEAQTSRRSNEEAGFINGRGLRGRKVYPHHNLPDRIKESYWQDPLNAKLKTSLTNYFREYRRPQKDGKEQRDSQNRSIQGWVKKNTEFQFDIHFINLSDVELGTLIWLLRLPVDHFHRFGGGKPLGFGSVDLRLEDEDSEIISGKKIRERYLSLDVTSGNSITAEKCKEAFESAVQSAYPDAKTLEAFKQSAKGFSDNLPTHYPRARHYRMIEVEDGQGKKRKRRDFINKENEPLPPHEDGLAYEWFVANSKEKDGQVKFGHVLPNLVGGKDVPDEGLEILDFEVKEKNQNRTRQNHRHRGGGGR